MFQLFKQFISFRNCGVAQMGVVSGLNPLLGTDAPPVSVVKLPFALLRNKMLDLLSDCQKNTTKDRMFFKLHSAESARELWQLRGDVYSLLATEFTQTEATRRVNGLLPSFEGWVPEWQLKPIR